MATDQRKTFFDKSIKNKAGALALWQRPNKFLITWFVALVFAKLLGLGPLDTAARVIAFGAIVIWAALEVGQGVNYFRRALGLLILTAVLWGAVMSPHGILHSLR